MELGLKLNKKLIPVLYRNPTKASEMHEKLAATNWVYLRENDDFEGTIPKLIDAINTDLEWVRKHTQLLNQAVEWENSSKNNSFLLGGAKLQDAEQWLGEATSKEDRHVLPLQAEYISISRKVATQNQRKLTITMTLLVIAAVVFGVFALISRNQARQAELNARASEATAVANEQIAAACFNLGYLPGSNKSLITKPATTRVALGAALELLRPGGVVTIVAYPGHEGGGKERDAVRKWVGELSEEQFEVQYRVSPDRVQAPELSVVFRL